MESNSSERDILLSIYSDVYKDVHGIRPRGAAFPSNLSDEEIQAKLDELDKQLQEELEYDHLDDMDGDFDSGMASAGFGTDEDYGDYGDDW